MFSFLWHHIKPYKWFYFVMIICPIFGSFYPFAYNYAVKLLLDTVTSGAPFTYADLVTPIAIFLGFQIFMDIMWNIGSIAEWKSEPYVRKSIIVQSYADVQQHSYEFFQTHFGGVIVSKLKGLIDGYDRFWQEMYQGLMPKVMKSVVSICALFTVNAYLSSFVLLWSLVFVLIIYKLSKRLNHLSFQATESRHKIIGQLSDKITNIISIFSTPARKYELKSLQNYVSRDFVPKEVKLYKYDFLVQFVSCILYLVLSTFILFYMIHLRMNESISVGDFAFVFGMVIIVAQDIWDATVSLQDFTIVMGNFKSALSILKVPKKNFDLPTAKPLKVKNPTIEFRDVSFSYAEKNKVFDGLNIKIKAGEKVGIVGYSGSGKSTLINLLLRYFTLNHGQILIDGQDISKVQQDSLRANIAVIPQDTLLFNRTLLDNIKYSNPKASYRQVIDVSRQAYITKFINKMPKKYRTQVGERGIKLSGGQRQRIAIARALLKDAQILILDEATSSLDSKTEKDIKESLNTIMKNKKKTVIAIAHRLSTLRNMDRIIVLHNGQIIEEGKHSQLSKDENSFYKKLWRLQENNDEFPDD